jgi:hypothetical protein
MDSDILMGENQLFKVEVSPRKNGRASHNEGQDLIPQGGFDFSSGNPFLKPVYTTITESGLLTNDN